MNNSVSSFAVAVGKKKTLSLSGKESERGTISLLLQDLTLTWFLIESAVPLLKIYLTEIHIKLFFKCMFH